MSVHAPFEAKITLGVNGLIYRLLPFNYLFTTFFISVELVLKNAKISKCITIKVMYMAKVSFLLDKRVADRDGLYPVKLRISALQSNTVVGTGVFISEDAFTGDPAHFVADSFPRASEYNRELFALYYRYLSTIEDLRRDGRLYEMSGTDIKNYVNATIRAEERAAKQEEACTLLFMPLLMDYMAQCRTPKSRSTYDYTMKTIVRFYGSADTDGLRFSDINYAFLTKFDRWMENKEIGLASRGIVFRCIRTVYNYAINCGWVDLKLYPFRRFKIKQYHKEKVYLPEDKMRALLSLTFTEEQGAGLEMARDFFLLSFMLCGINPIDLFNLPCQQDTVSFVRQKIKYHEPQPIHITIQPEVRYLISQYQGKEHLLMFAEKYQNFESCYHFLKHRLKKLGEMIGCPDITFYWARYTWATYASKIDVSDSTISKALGHADSTLAEKKYISFDWSKVDRANRRVLDYALYGKE